MNAPLGLASLGAFFHCTPLANPCHCARVCEHRAVLAHRNLQMPFVPTKFQSAVSGGSAGSGYLNPSKIQSGGNVRFALLSEEPLCFYECWGESSDGSVRPFRFPDDPTPADIEQEMGPQYTRRLNREGTGPEPVKFALAVPVYNFETGTIQVLQMSQKSLIKELDNISQIEDYANLLEWDFVMGKTGQGLTTEYSLRPVPRKGATQKQIDKAWTAALTDGFDITRLIGGGNPFKEAA